MDRKILCTRSRGKDKFYIPGGKREVGESDHEALTREIREELSVQLLHDTIRYERTFEAQAHGYAEGMTVRMTCYTADFVGELAPSREIEEMLWMVHADWPRGAPAGKLIFDWLKQVDRID